MSKFSILNKENFNTENILSNDEKAKEIFEFIWEFVENSLNLVNSLQSKGSYLSANNKVSVSLAASIHEKYKIIKKEK